MKVGKKTRIALAVLVVLGLCGSVSVGWSEPVPANEVNTEYDDEGPFLSFDGLSLYFTRNYTDTLPDYRIYEARREAPYGPRTFWYPAEFSPLQNIF